MEPDCMVYSNYVVGISRIAYEDAWRHVKECSTCQESLAFDFEEYKKNGCIPFAEFLQLPPNIETPEDLMRTVRLVTIRKLEQNEHFIDQYREKLATAEGIDAIAKLLRRQGRAIRISAMGQIHQEISTNEVRMICEAYAALLELLGENAFTMLFHCDTSAEFLHDIEQGWRQAFQLPPLNSSSPPPPSA